MINIKKLFLTTIIAANITELNINASNDTQTDPQDTSSLYNVLAKHIDCLKKVNFGSAQQDVEKCIEQLTDNAIEFSEKNQPAPNLKTRIRRNQILFLNELWLKSKIKNNWQAHAFASNATSTGNDKLERLKKQSESITKKQN